MVAPGTIEPMARTARFDPSAPLPDAPDPWAPSEMPPIRAGAPFAMTEMIAAEPALAARLTDRTQRDPTLALVVAALVRAAKTAQPITVTGCGTSHHAAMVVASLLTDGLANRRLTDARVTAVQAFELSARVPRGGVVIAISHEGGTEATNEALRAARRADAVTVLVTVSDRSPGARLADHVLRTAEQDQSWCHTVGYLSPIVAGAVMHGALRGVRLRPPAVERQVAAGSDAPHALRIARVLGRVERLLVVGSGLDYAAARELALKVEEGAHLPATAHELETARHGHLAAANERVGLVAVLTDGEGRGEILTQRTATILRAARTLGMPAALIAAADRATPVISALPTAGTIGTALTRGLPRPVASSLAVVTPLQLVTERLARVRGTNPDPIGRDDPRQAAAASV